MKTSDTGGDDALVGGPRTSKELCAQSCLFYEFELRDLFHSLQMRSAYDAIILGTEKNVLSPEGLYIAMTHQREMLMVSAL